MTEEDIAKNYPWATTGKTSDRKRNVITSLELDSAKMEKFNHKLMEKYKKLEENEVRYEEIQTKDAEYLLIAYGTSSRICQKTVELARKEGIKLGLLRPITLFPFPKKRIAELTSQVKGILSVEMSAGQMVEDVKLAVDGKVPVDYFGRLGGIVPSPEEVLEAAKQKIL